MSPDIQMTFRHLDPSAERVSLLEHQARKLCREQNAVLRVSVLVERPHHHHRQGDPYRIRLLCKVRGGQIVASHSPQALLDHATLRSAIDNAFRSAHRQLCATSQRLRTRRRKHPETRGEL